MKNDIKINLVSIVSILIVLIGFGLSIVSYFFNKMLPEGIISPDFPPFYLFFIGAVLFLVGLFRFFWEKIKKFGKKKMRISVTIIVVFILILSLPIINRCIPIQTTSRLIISEHVVWQTNESVATETSARDLFESHVMEFWESSLDILRDNNFTYSENAVPLLQQMRVYSSMNRWEIKVPIIHKGADWRFGFLDGYIEINEEGWWHYSGRIWFNVEKEMGVVRVEVS